MKPIQDLIDIFFDNFNQDPEMSWYIAWIHSSGDCNWSRYTLEDDEDVTADWAIMEVRDYIMDGGCVPFVSLEVFPFSRGKWDWLFVPFWQDEEMITGRYDHFTGQHTIHNSTPMRATCWMPTTRLHLTRRFIESWQKVTMTKPMHHN